MAATAATGNSNVGGAANYTNQAADDMSKEADLNYAANQKLQASKDKMDGLNQLTKTIAKAHSDGFQTADKIIG